MEVKKEEVRVRRAVKEDSLLLAWAVLESTRGHQARGFMDVRFSFLERDEDILRVLQQMVEDDAPTCVRWDSFLIAELDGQPAAGTDRSKPPTHLFGGVSFFFNSDECSRVLLRPEREALRWLLRHVQARRGQPGLAR
jgi:hypothetical protein